HVRGRRLVVRGGPARRDDRGARLRGLFAARGGRDAGAGDGAGARRGVLDRGGVGRDGACIRDRGRMMRWACVAMAAACAPEVAPRAPAPVLAREEVPLPDAGSPAATGPARGRLDPAGVPELPQMWRAPEVQLEAAAVDGGAGV